MQRRMRFVILAVFVSVLTLQAVAALAYWVSPWTRYAEGVEHAWGYTESPRLMRAFAVRVSLRNPNVSMFVTPGNGGDPWETYMQTTPDFMYTYGLTAAINANFFGQSGSYGDPYGYVYSAGNWVSGYDASKNITMCFDWGSTPYISSDSYLPGGTRDAVAGDAWHLFNGQWLGDNSTLNPRTSLGITQDYKYLIMCVVDGRQSGWSDGATVYDMSNWMASFGAYNAINLDGGGSSCIARSDAGVMNSPSDGSPRSVAANLGVKTWGWSWAGPSSDSPDGSRIDIFWRGHLGHLWQKCWTAGGGWSGLYDIGGSMYDSPGVVWRDTNNLSVFVRGGDNALWGRDYNTSQGWGNFYPIGGACSSGPSACSRSANSMDVVVRGTSNDIWLFQWNSSQGWYSSYSLEGVCTSAPAICARDANHLDVFAVGTNGYLYGKSWTNGIGWGGWYSLGIQGTADPAVCSRTPTTMDVFVRGADHAIWSRHYDASTNWQNPYSLGGVSAGKVAASAREANRMDVFVRGTDDHLYHNWWSSNVWSGFIDMGANF